MTIQVIDAGRQDCTAFAELATEKKAAYISLSSIGRVTVVCQNAAHKVWRGSGRSFANWDEAEAGYKSGDMKAMIQHARDMLYAAFS